MPQLQLSSYMVNAFVYAFLYTDLLVANLSNALGELQETLQVAAHLGQN